MFSIIKFLVMVIKFFWRKGWGILNPNINPMRNAPMYAKYCATVVLGLFWSLAFGLYTAQFFYIGINMIAHVAVISAAFLTWTTFNGFKRVYPDVYPVMRDLAKAQRCYELTDEERKMAAKRADQLLTIQRNQL
jgi:hypothetical protein